MAVTTTTIITTLALEQFYFIATCYLLIECGCHLMDMDTIQAIMVVDTLMSALTTTTTELETTLKSQTLILVSQPIENRLSNRQMLERVLATSKHRSKNLLQPSEVFKRETLPRLKVVDLVQEVLDHHVL